MDNKVISSEAFREFANRVSCFASELDNVQKMYDNVMTNKGFQQAKLDSLAESNREELVNLIARFNKIDEEIQTSITKAGQTTDAALEAASATFKSI